MEGGGLATQRFRMRTAPSTMLRMVPLPVPGRIQGVAMNASIGSSFGADRSASFIAWFNIAQP